MAASDRHPLRHIAGADEASTISRGAVRRHTAILMIISVPGTVDAEKDIVVVNLLDDDVPGSERSLLRQVAYCERSGRCTGSSCGTESTDAGSLLRSEMVNPAALVTTTGEISDGTRGRSVVQVDRPGAIAGPDPSSLVDVGSETSALQLNGVDADVPEPLATQRRLTAWRVGATSMTRPSMGDVKPPEGGDRKAWAHVLRL